MNIRYIDTITKRNFAFLSTILDVLKILYIYYTFTYLLEIQEHAYIFNSQKIIINVQIRIEIVKLYFDKNRCFRSIIL
jgi:hypothetical protein